jgi:hypothetical protein
MSERASRLPVGVLLPVRLTDEVTRYVERELGWQRVPLQGPPAPALVLAERPVAGLPTVVLRTLTSEAVPPDAQADGVLDVIAWPAERERLRGCADRLPSVAHHEVGQEGGWCVRVGGVVPGIGASTLALAIGGLLAWSGRPAAVVGGPGLLRLAGVGPWRGPGADELACLDPREAAQEFPRVAHRCRAVPGLWVLAGSPRPYGQGWPVACTVVDVGVGEADVLAAAAGGVRVLLRAGSPPAALPASARVARAAMRGRVPAGMPGTYLAALRRGLGLGTGLAR